MNSDSDGSDSESEGELIGRGSSEFRAFVLARNASRQKALIRSRFRARRRLSQFGPDFRIVSLVRHLPQKSNALKRWQKQ